MTPMMNNHTYRITLSNILLGLAGLVFILGIWWFGKNNLAQPTGLPEVSVVASPAFAKVSIEAKAVFVYDDKTGEEIYNKNANAQLPLASLTKIMTAVTALSFISEETILTIDSSFLQGEGDSGLFGDERWKLKDLLDLTLLVSSNDGADAIADAAGRAAIAMAQSQTATVSKAIAVSEPISNNLAREQFVEAMNKKAVDIGLTQTYFLNPTGLDENASLSGGYGSARDVAILFSRAIAKYPELFGATRYTSREIISLSDLKHDVKNTNTFVGSIPSLLGSKTGFTDLAGGNLVIAFDAGFDRPIIVSVLGSTEQGRFEDAEKLVYATLDYLDGR